MGLFAGTDLQFDTDTLKRGSQEYTRIADDLESNAERLSTLLEDLSSTDWTTAAGKAFQDMVKSNYLDSVNKYIALLRMLSGILDDAVIRYDDLTSAHIEQTKLSAQ